MPTIWGNRWGAGDWAESLGPCGTAREREREAEEFGGQVESVAGNRKKLRAPAPAV